MVWETQKPKEPGKSFMSRAISVPLPTPDGPAITRGRTDMGSSAAQQGGAARALLLLLLQGADERTGLGEEEVVCGEGGRWRGEGTWWWRGGARPWSPLPGAASNGRSWTRRGLVTALVCTSFAEAASG